MNNKVILALTTHYEKPKGTRYELALQTIENATKAGHLVVIVDGSPFAVFSELLSSGANVFLQNHSGLGSAKRQVAFHAHELAMALGYDIILMVEPEKDLTDYIPEIIAPILAETAHIVIPARTEKSWKSYPEFQQKTERDANEAFRLITGYELDIMFGPVAFRVEASQYYIANNPKMVNARDTYIQQYGTQVAAQKGLIVQSVLIDWEYPRKQCEEEEGLLKEAMTAKREEQMQTLIEAYQAFRGRKKAN